MNDILKAILDPLMAGLATAAAGALVAWLIRLAQKYGLQVTAAQQQQLQTKARDVILATEEWAASRVKAQVPVKASDKLLNAVDALQAKTGLSSQDAADLIHTVLPQLGLGASAAPALEQITAVAVPLAGAAK